MENTEKICGHKRPDQNLDHYTKEVDKVFKKKYETIVQLERPNFVWNVNDNSKQIGKWTMVYDEGFEFDIGNQVFFSFNKYKQVGKFTAKNTDTEETAGYQSECDQTFVGWYHNSLTNENWGCYWAEKITKQKLQTYNTKAIDYDNLFKSARIPLHPQAKIIINKQNLKSMNDLITKKIDIKAEK